MKMILWSHSVVCSLFVKTPDIKIVQSPVQVITLGQAPGVSPVIWLHLHPLPHLLLAEVAHPDENNSVEA